MKQSYDIFISYRRDGGAPYARILQLMLTQRGYNVFLDYDELTDGVFGEHIKNAIKNASIFILVLSAHSMDRCVNEDDWVRQEIKLALDEGKQIIPIDPDSTFNGIPENAPDFINTVVNSYARSEVHFGQTLGITVDFMIDHRIVPIIGRRDIKGLLDTDADAAMARLEGQKRHRSRNIVYAAMAVLVALISVCSIWYAVRLKEMKSLKADVLIEGIYMNWSDDASLEQLRAIHEILGCMEYLHGGSFMMGAAPSPGGSYHSDVDTYLETPQIECKVDPFYMSKYEVTVGQWAAVMNERFDSKSAQLPKTDVSFYDCQEFITTLINLTGLSFSLPSESEWEYAARGGDYPDNTVYSGSDEPLKVARYAANSGSRPHQCNAKISGMDANGADLFDMSGNVSEWCDTPFRLYSDIADGNADPEILDAESMVIRGGNYLSEPYELTVTHRDPMSAGSSMATLGLRLVLKN